MTEITNDTEADVLRREVLLRMRDLDRRFPGENAFMSIMNQLNYIGDYLKPGVVTMPRADEMTFGLLGVKVVMEFSDEISRDLSALSAYVRKRFGG
jgi:hypothetical protein